MTRIATGAGALLNALPPLAMLVLLFRYTRNVPFSDTWGFVPTIAAYVRHGPIGLNDIISPDGSGRPVVWRVLMLLDARLFDFNVQLLKALALPAILIGVGSYYWLIKRTLPRASTWIHLLALLPISLVLFSFSGWESFLEEWSVQNLAAVNVSVCSVVVVAAYFSNASARWWWLAGGIAGCLFAAFLGEPGLIAWPASLIAAFLPWGRAAPKARLLLLAATGIFFATYLAGGVPTPFHYALSHPIHVLHFAVAGLGNGFLGVGPGNTDIGAATAVGIGEIVLLALAGLLGFTHRQSIDRHLCRMYAALCGFGVMASLLIAVGRAGMFPLATATSSRYIAITAPAMIGLFLFYLHLVAAGGVSNVRPRKNAGSAMARFSRPAVD